MRCSIARPGLDGPTRRLVDKAESVFASKDLFFARSQFVVRCSHRAELHQASDQRGDPDAHSCDSSRTVVMWGQRTCDSSLGWARDASMFVKWPSALLVRVGGRG